MHHKDILKISLTYIIITIITPWHLCVKTVLCYKMLGFLLSNQKTDMQKGKDKVAPSKTYANIVLQAEPPHNEGPSHKETPQTNNQNNTGDETQGEGLYQGPTSLYETPMEVESMRDITLPKTPERNTIPTYD